MIKLVSKIFLLIGITFLLAFFIRMPIATYWHSPPMQAKYDYLCENPHKFDFVFMGTSRIARGLDPVVYDRVYSKLAGNNNTNSLNMAIAGTVLGENLAMFNHLLKIDNFKPKYIVYELNSVHNAVGRNVSEVNLHTERVNYWMDFKMLLFSIDNVFNFRTKIHTKNRVKFAKNYMSAFVENSLNTGMFESFLLGYKNKEYENIKEALGTNRGFKTYTGKRKKGSQKQINNWITKHLKPELNKRKRVNKAVFQDEKWMDEPVDNKTYLSTMLEMIKQCEAKDIHLIFLVPPMLKQEILYEIAPLYKALPKKNKVEIADGGLYQELYTVANAYDAVHFNKNGSELFSKYTAQRIYNTIVKNNTIKTK